MTELFPNPDPVVLAFVVATQERELAKLNQLTTWTDEEFYIAVDCYKTWWPIEKEWQLTGEAVSKLMDNPRASASKKIRMRESYSRIINSKSFLSDRQN